MAGSEGEIKTVRAVERAVDVLMCFTQDRHTLSVTDLQRSLSLSRPTLYRLLQTLEGKGLIRSFGDPQRFQLAHGAIELGNAALAPIDVARVGQRHLRALWEATDETVALMVPVAGGVKVCVEEIQSRQPLVFQRGAGFTEPMTVGASGKAMLAFMGEDRVEEALRDLDGPADREALRMELADVRRNGFRISTGEIIDGAVAIAAPVFDRDGGVAGSVCVFGPEVRLTGAQRDRCVAEVVATGRRISEAMGYRPAPGADMLGAAE